MRIRIKDRAKLQPGKMAKIALAATPRALLDLYCVAPGQEQKPHTHSDQDKFYVVVEGRGRFRLGDASTPWKPGTRSSRRPASSTGSSTTATRACSSSSS